MEVNQNSTFFSHLKSNKTGRLDVLLLKFTRDFGSTATLSSWFDELSPQPPLGGVSASAVNKAIIHSLRQV